MFVFFEEMQKDACIYVRDGTEVSAWQALSEETSLNMVTVTQIQKTTQLSKFGFRTTHIFAN